MHSQMFTRAMLLAFLVCAHMPVTSHAQPRYTPAIPEAQRKEALSILKDSNSSDDARLAALKRLKYPPVSIEATLLEIMKDKKRGDVLRLEAALRHPYTEEWVKAVLAILSDDKDGGEKLDAELVATLSRRIVSRPPAELRQNIYQVFRRLLDDPRKSVRLAAYRALIPGNDEEAVKLLTDELRNHPENPPIPVDEALNLLYAAGPVYHLQSIRPYLKSKDEKVQYQAVRALATDPQSQGQILEIVRNRETATPVRSEGIKALVRADKTQSPVALGMLEDQTESPEMRYACASAYLSQMKRGTVEPALQVRYAEGVESLKSATFADTPKAANLKKAVVDLHDQLQKGYPAIREHYQKQQ